MRTRSSLSLAFACVLASACTGVEREPEPTPEPRAVAQELGEISFPTSCAPAAQPAFLHGVLLLHSFEYDDAAEAFCEAQTLDRRFVMAYWGEALTHSHPIWNQEDVPAAQAALAKLAPTAEQRAALATDPRERALLATVETLFGEGDRGARHAAYSQALGKLHEEYPSDHEIAAFYALSILATSLQGRDERIYMRAAAVAEQVYAENPNHPGALHYLIHSYDDPVHAPLGLRFARRYDKVAPSAAHALHMPSHIYVALGMWEDAVAANIASSKAADERRARKDLALDARGYHSIWWLAYSYLQLGRVAEARALVDEVRRDAEECGSERTRSHFLSMRNDYLIATREWDGEVAPRMPDLSGLGPRLVASHHLVNGLAALGRGELAAADVELAAVRATLPDPSSVADGAPTRSGATCCAPKGYDGLNDVAVRQACAVMAKELEGAVALRRGVVEQGLAVLREAAALEDAMDFDFGPPIVVKPAHELLGEELLAQGRASEAVPEFQAALRRAPRRTLSLTGLERSASKAGDERVAREAREELARSLVRADADFLARTGIEVASGR